MAEKKSIHKYQKIQVAVGQRFGRWTVVAELPYEPYQKHRILCRWFLCSFFLFFQRC